MKTLIAFGTLLIACTTLQAAPLKNLSGEMARFFIDVFAAIELHNDT